MYTYALYAWGVFVFTQIMLLTFVIMLSQTINVAASSERECGDNPMERETLRYAMSGFMSKNSGLWTATFVVLFIGGALTAALCVLYVVKKTAVLYNVADGIGEARSMSGLFVGSIERAGGWLQVLAPLTYPLVMLIVYAVDMYVLWSIRTDALAFSAAYQDLMTSDAAYKWLQDLAKNNPAFGTSTSIIDNFPAGLRKRLIARAISEDPLSIQSAADAQNLFKHDPKQVVQYLSYALSSRDIRDLMNSGAMLKQKGWSSRRDMPPDVLASTQHQVHIQVRAANITLTVDEFVEVMTALGTNTIFTPLFNSLLTTIPTKPTIDLQSNLSNLTNTNLSEPYASIYASLSKAWPPDSVALIQTLVMTHDGFPAAYIDALLHLGEYDKLASYCNTTPTIASQNTSRVVVDRLDVEDVGIWWQGRVSTMYVLAVIGLAVAGFALFHMAFVHHVTWMLVMAVFFVLFLTTLSTWVAGA